MDVLRPGDDGYDEAATSYHVHGSPVEVLRPRDPAEAAEAVRRAVRGGLAIAVRAGGHTPWSTNEGGVIVDLRRLRAVTVEGDGRVRVGGGAVWGEVADALAPHGVAISSGDTASVGVGGLTLGGGIGWLVRANGLAIDHLLEAEVVTATGEVVRASESENAELFWALRGGGGNFGIVTEFVFEARPLPGLVTGTLEFDPAEPASVLGAWRDALRSAPDEWTSTLIALPAFGPGMPPSLQAVVAWAGTDVAAAEGASRPLLDHPAFRSGALAPGSYRELLAEEPPEMEGAPPTMVDESELVGRLDDDTIERIVAAHERLEPSVMMLRTLGGAYARVPADATAFAHRQAEAFLVSAALLAPGSPPDAIAAARTVWAQAMGDASLGSYGNFRPTRGPGVVAAMYPPETLTRLREAKARWDPANVFAGNHNIPPA
jgi:FAD/FMN-containing dehydrogenase